MRNETLIFPAAAAVAATAVASEPAATVAVVYFGLLSQPPSILSPRRPHRPRSPTRSFACAVGWTRFRWRF